MEITRNVGVLPLLGCLAITAMGLLSGCSSNSAAGPRVRTDKMTSLFDRMTLDGWIQIPADSWTVRDGAMASLGAGRGVLYTE